jgi:hypothetical protein
MSVIDWSKVPERELAAEAAGYRGDHDDGSAFFFDAEDGCWRFEMVDPAMLGAFASADEARDWIEAEILMFEKDGNESRATFYRSMLEAGFSEPVTIGQVGSEGRLWDGWHRTAVAIARGERLPAIVGTPRSLPGPADRSH